jgi:hypothetical protein
MAKKQQERNRQARITFDKRQQEVEARRKAAALVQESMYREYAHKVAEQTQRRLRSKALREKKEERKQKKLEVVPY